MLNSHTRKTVYATPFKTYVPVLLLLLLWSLAGGSNPIPVGGDWVIRTWGQPEGGPTNRVNDVIESQDGFLWLATYEGLIRFDGDQHRIYNEKHHSALIGGIFTVRESPNRDLWMLSSSGYLLRLRKDQFSSWPASAGLTSDSLAEISFFSDGRLVVPGLRGFLTVNEEDELVPLAMGDMDTIESNFNGVDAQDRVWVAAMDGGLWCWDGMRATFFDLVLLGAPGSHANAFHLLNDGTMWLAVNGQIALFNPADKSMRVIPQDQFFEPNRVLRFSKNSDEAVLVGSVNSPAHLLSRDRIEVLRLGSGTEEIILNATAMSSGGYAIASYDRGLILMRESQFHVFTHQQGLRGTIINAIHPYGENKWLVASAKGVEVFDGENFEIFPIADRPFGDFTLDVFVDSRNRLWIATIGDGAFVLDGENWTQIDRRDGLRSGSVRCFAEDAHGRIWIGTGAGIYVWDEQIVAYYGQEQGFASELILSIHVDNEGRVWTGTAQGGLHLINDGKVSRIEGPPSPVAYSARPVFGLNADRSGAIWGGTAGGVIRIQGQQVDFLDLAPALNLSSVFHVADDGKDSFWITSSTGLFQVPYQFLHECADKGHFTPTAYRNFGREDGLPTDAVRPNSRILIEPGGKIWFPAEVGFFIMDPAHVTEPLPPPTTLIDGVLINNNELPLVRARPDLNKMLDPGLRRIVVNFSSPYFGSSQRLLHRVRLVGFEPEWRMVSGRMAEYTNLPPSQYSLEVQAVIEGQSASDATATVKFYVRPFFHQTPLFLILMAGLVIGSILGIIHFRTRLMRARQRELQNIVAQRTAEIRESEQRLAESNSMLQKVNAEKDEFMGIAAHDLRNPVATIRSIADLLEMEHAEQGFEDVNSLIKDIQQSAESMEELISNLLDINRIEHGQMTASIAPVNITDIATMVVDRCSRAIAAKDIRIRFERSGAISIVVLADAQILQQILDNLLSNAIKFSHPGSRVWLECGSRDTETLRIAVRDEGPGISKQDQQRLFKRFARLSARPTAGEPSTGLGLSIAKRLTELIGGSIGYDTELGKGTTFWIELPIAPIPQRG